MKYIITTGMLFLSMTYAIVITAEIVVDNKTRLEWQNQSINKTAMGNWLESITYCKDLILDTKDDWRLPNINELKSLIDYTENSPSVVSILADTTANKRYWSSTTYSISTDNGYMVDFSSGMIYYKNKSTHEGNVRCVRDKTN